VTAARRTYAAGVDTMSAAEAAALTERIGDRAERLWALLMEANSREAWETLGHPSWEAYVAGEFDVARSPGFRLLERARVLPDDEEEPELALSESQAKTLVDQIVLSLEALAMGIDMVDVSSLAPDAHAAGVITDAVESLVRLRDALQARTPPQA
jgi:hypothetical protein